MQCCSQPVVHRKRCDETAFHKVVPCHSHAVGHRKRCDETALQKMCNVTHSLLVIGKEVMRRLPFTKMCNDTHMLLVIGKDVMGLPFTKCAMSLTCCWSYENAIHINVQ